VLGLNTDDLEFHENRSHIPQKSVKPGNENTKPDTVGRHRYTSLWLLTIYIPLLIIPWVLICVAVYRPINLPSYQNQAGWYSPAQIDANYNWQRAIRVANSVLSLITVPVTSAILAQSAVIYSQRRKDSTQLSFIQLLALVNRGWADVVTMCSARHKTPEKRIGSSFLWFAASLTLLSECNSP